MHVHHEHLEHPSHVSYHRIVEKPTKSQFQAYLAGQMEAQKFIEDERDRRLAEMTPSEIRDPFDALSCGCTSGWNPRGRDR